MKKFAKYALLVGCIALFIFLLLPFLEPPSLQSASASADDKPAATPQVFTANPLTDIVNRLARFFQKDASQNRLQTQTAAAPQGAAGPDSTPGQELPANAESSYRAADLYAANATQNPATEGAPFVEGNEEWLLVQQRSPETAHSGMHEINVKENAYDQYVKQERAARFTPTARMQKPQEVPDSKWARVFAPFRRFFGFGDDSSSQPGSLGSDATAQGGSAGGSTGDSDGLGNKPDPNKKPLVLPNGRLLEVARFSKDPITPSGSGGRITGRDVINGLDPFSSIRRSSERVADSRYPQDEQARQEAQQNEEQNYQNQRAAAYLAHLAELAQGRPTVDLMNQTFNCDPLHGTIREDVGCNRPLTDEEKEQIRQENLAYFKEQTGDDLPNDVQLVPILSIAKDPLPITPNEEKTKDSPDSAYFLKELYNSMLADKNCQSGSCFWEIVADDNGPAGESGFPETENVKDIIDLAGFNLAGATADERKKAIDNYFAKHPEITDEQKPKIREIMEKEPYVVSTAKDIDQRCQGKSCVPYFPGAETAQTYRQQFNQPTTMVPSSANNTALNGSNVEQGAKQVMQDFVGQMKWSAEQNKKTQQDADQKVIQNTLAPKVQTIKQLTTNQITNYQNPYGHTEKK